MRPKSRKIGVLITDGKSQDDVIVNSQNLRDQGIELYAIGRRRSVLFTCTNTMYEDKFLHVSKCQCLLSSLLLSRCEER